MNPSDSITLMSAAHVQRTMQRIAHEIYENNKKNYPIKLLGINERGLVLAQMLRAMLSKLCDVRVTADQLKVDKESTNKDALFVEKQETAPFTVIVDDVIFSGQTMFKALQAVVGALNPDEIYTVALIDRGHRKIPVQAIFCGLELPTKLDEHVSVIAEDKEVEEVVLTYQ